MSDLRRFPVSDEFISYRQTLDSVCDRMNFFEFSVRNPLYFDLSTTFSRKWKLFGQSVEMSGMTLRIDWNHSRVLAGPPSGRNPLVKCGLDTSAPFSGVSGNLKNGRCRKKCYQSRANFFWADGTGPGSIGGLAVALSPETVLIPRENPGCCRFASLGIPFSTLRFLDCRDPGFASRIEERWSWVTVAL